MKQQLMNSTAVRLCYWLVGKCPDGKGCPPKLWDILTGAGGGC